MLSFLTFRQLHHCIVYPPELPAPRSKNSTCKDLVVVQKRQHFSWPAGMGGVPNSAQLLTRVRLRPGVLHSFLQLRSMERCLPGHTAAQASRHDSHPIYWLGLLLGNVLSVRLHVGCSFAEAYFTGIACGTASRELAARLHRRIWQQSELQSRTLAQMGGVAAAVLAANGNVSDLRARQSLQRLALSLRQTAPTPAVKTAAGLLFDCLYAPPAAAAAEDNLEAE